MLAPWIWREGLHVLPIAHGSAVFAMAVRQALWSGRYRTLALAFPSGWDELLNDGLGALPEAQAAIFRESGSPRSYLPFDPCDAYVEAWRQARQRGLPCYDLEDHTRFGLRREVHLPDPQLLPTLGAAQYHALACQQGQERQSTPLPEPWLDLAPKVANRLHRLLEKAEEAKREQEEQEGYEGDGEQGRRTENFGIQGPATGAPRAPMLFLCDYPLLPLVEKAFFAQAGPDQELYGAWGEPGIWQAKLAYIKPGQIYFAFGEPPFFAAEVERERQNPLASPKPYFELVKSLFLRTREQFLDLAVERRSVTVKGVQQALTYARNLAAMEGRLSPSLFDLVIAAKGIFGSGFAGKLLEAARYYPYFAPEREAWLEIGLDRIREPSGADKYGVSEAFNLLEDSPKIWRHVKLKQEPDRRKQQQYRYAWDNRGLCSHLPEDARIERFNRVVRARAREKDMQAHSRVERLTSSLKDGIDIRETLRQWHTQTIYVRETPPQTRRVDTVIMIFDAGHDERYPQRVTWYAEHPGESTLTFYATDPMARLIGPGVSEAEYGGLSLLFPPRHVPDVFALNPEAMGFRNLAEQLTYGALLHSREKTLAYVAERPPALRLKLMARRFGRKLAHIPLGNFSAETLRRLRRFHMLNGKEVRSWAARFIAD